MDQKRAKELENKIVHTTLHRKDDLEKFCSTSSQEESGSMKDNLRKSESSNSSQKDVMSSSCSSIYSTAEEDFQSNESESDNEAEAGPSEIIESLKILQNETSAESGPSLPKVWIATPSGTLAKQNNSYMKEKLRKTKSAGPALLPDFLNNERISPGRGSKTSLLEVPGAEINQLQDPEKGVLSRSKAGSSTTLTDEDEYKSLDLSRSQEWGHGSFTVAELQRIFDAFKSAGLSSEECERLIDMLGVSQSRNDFQWTLYQLGGFNALLYLYARVVELFPDDAIQSKLLAICLSQLKNHAKVTDISHSVNYNLLRFLLNSTKSTFGFKTFHVLVHHCLTSSGTKLVDYELLDSCLLSSWKLLIRVRCLESEAPTGRRTLFECLLTVILDLLLEKNNHRAVNTAELKARNFPDRLLSICCSILSETGSSGFGSKVEESGDSPKAGPSSSSPENHRNIPLSCIDALRICALVKSIFMELMAPPDAYVALSLVRFGLYPLLPSEFPPLPERENAFFLYQVKKPSFALIAEEYLESSQGSPPKSPYLNVSDLPPEQIMNFTPSEESRVIMLNEDIPEIVGSSPKFYGKESFESSQFDAFKETFQESLMEGLMSVLLNALAILPDAAFFSVLRPHLSSYLFLAYSSHPRLSMKTLAVKLLTSFLSRVKNPCITEFLRNKGFFLASLYLREEPSIAPVISGICSGFGPISYPLALGLLDTPAVLTSLQEWVESDPDTVVPALMSMGLFPAIINFYGNRALPLPRALCSLIQETIKALALSPKEDPWKALFTPALEAAPAGNQLTGRLYQEAITLLKEYQGKELKRPELFHRLLWLLERSSAGKFGTAFDRFLLDLFTKDVMELEMSLAEEERTEGWKSFVKKHKKRLCYLMGVFLSRLFTPHKSDFEVKQQALRLLLQGCSNLEVWLPKVLKCDSGVERCFTAFLRIFLCEANQKESCQSLEESNAISRTRACQSFQALVAEGNRLSRQLQVQVTVPDETLPEDPEEIHSVHDPFEVEADKSLRTRFESVLVKAGILSPTNSYSTFSADFRKFKILLETPPICGVSYQELRVCLNLLEKIRSSLTPQPAAYHNDEFQGRKAASKTKGYACNALYFSSIFETVSKFAIDVVDSVTRTRTQMGIEIVKATCTREKDILARQRWWSMAESLGHPKAPWHIPELYPKFWSLDQSEGPGRIRTRLFREHLKLHQKFVLPSHRVSEEATKAPLEFLFSCDQNYDDLMSFPSIKAEIQYMRFCTRIIPGEEICGEIILSKETLYFIPEFGNGADDGNKSETFEVPIPSILYLLRRRYTHENRAVELFIGCRSFLFTFRNCKDREEFLSVIQLKPERTAESSLQRKNSLLMESSLTSMTNRWLKGGLSNFEYLMYLNTAAGRTYCDLMQYPVFPFVLAKYETPTLDLSAPQSYRDLRRPMAVQDPVKEEHYVSTYNYLKRECDSTPFHYGSHYSNSGIVLHYLIRLPPYTQHFLRYQDGSFDIPDRSFHSIETTYRLSARDSNTDFKEAIPEFYYLPEFLKNLDHYDFGVRQNGKRVDDVKLPPWAKGDPRLFTLINRQALESNHVRKLLCDWIDLIFGYKQSGKAAIMAVNVFHPSTYEGFEVEGIADDLVKRARRAMVSTYGQTPKQLFTTTHPRSMAMSVENCDMEVLDTVWGIRWGYFLGSPTCSELQVVHKREYADEMSLFETPTRIVFWPKATLIMGDKVVGSWSSNEIVIRSKTVYLCIGDEITVCSTSETSIWIGHQSGKISVLKFSPALEKAVETIELVGHYRPVKCIDLNFEFATAVSCSGEDHAIIWNMNSTAYVNHIQLHSSIDCVHSSRSTGDIAVVSWTANTVTLTTINGFQVGSVCPEEKVESACISNMDPGRNVNLLAVGCDYGHIKFYSTWDLKFINEIKVVPLMTLPIQSIRYSKDGRRLYCLSTNEEVSISAALQLPDTAK